MNEFVNGYEYLRRKYAEQQATIGELKRRLLEMYECDYFNSRLSVMEIEEYRRELGAKREHDNEDPHND